MIMTHWVTHKGLACARTEQDRAVDGIGRMRGIKSLEDPHNNNRYKGQGTFPST